MTCRNQSTLLDTSIRQAEAQGLHRGLGFHDIAPYYELPEALRSWLVFMELLLEAQDRSESRTSRCVRRATRSRCAASNVVGLGALEWRGVPVPQVEREPPL